MSSENRPTTFGVLLCLLGIILLGAGLWLAGTGEHNFYFAVVGLGIAASGALIAAGKLIGAWLYALVVVIVIWSFIELGPNLPLLLPRIAMPVIIAAYIFSGRVRPLLR